MIISKTPLRISLVGGGTDVPAFYKQSNGAVLSFTINKFVYVAINDKFDHRFRVSYSQTENVETIEEIQHDIVKTVLNEFISKTKNGLEVVSMADIPGEGSGLGSSSSFTVGLVSALEHKYFQEQKQEGRLAEFSFEIEKRVNSSIGKQDHYAAACGGLNLFQFTDTHVEITPMDADMVSDNLLLLWTGISRSARRRLKEQAKAFESNPSVLKNGKDMAFIAKALASEIGRGNLNAIGPYLHENWTLKKKLHDDVSSEQIDAWYEIAIKNGAIGGKLCGAGGGGFMLFYAPQEKHEDIVNATGLRKIDFEIETEGSRIVYGD